MASRRIQGPELRRTRHRVLYAEKNQQNLGFDERQWMGTYIQTETRQQGNIQKYYYVRGSGVDWVLVCSHQDGAHSKGQGALEAVFATSVNTRARMDL